MVLEKSRKLQAFDYLIDISPIVSNPALEGLSLQEKSNKLY
jgi:hypothetical protein